MGSASRIHGGAETATTTGTWQGDKIISHLRVMTVVRSVAGSLWKDCGHQAATNRRGLSDHDLDPLKLFDLGVASSRHGLSQRSQQVHGAVGNCRWTQQDVLQGADR